MNGNRPLSLLREAIWKIQGKDSRRPSRFHTARGDLLPMAGFLTIPYRLIARFGPARLTAGYPWLAPPAVRRIAAAIDKSWNVFEFGAGNSTLWFASRAGSVVSVEHDREWFERVSGNLARRGLGNCRLRLAGADEYAGSILEHQDSSFDLVLVDGPDDSSGKSRLECIRMSMNKVKRNGLLVLDNSDRLEYRAADDILAGWPVSRFIGMPVGSLIAVETSIYIRPA